MPRSLVVASAWLFGLFMIALTVYVSTDNRFGLMNQVRRVPGGDKTGHFFLMGMLAFLVTLATARPWLTRIGSHVARWGTLVAIVIAAEEYSQRYFPTRTFSMLDMAASLGGILVFSLLSFLVLRARQRA